MQMLADQAIQALDFESMGFHDSILAAQTISEAHDVPLADVLDVMDDRDPRTCAATSNLLDGDMPLVAREWAASDLRLDPDGLLFRIDPFAVEPFTADPFAA